MPVDGTRKTTYTLKCTDGTEVKDMNTFVVGGAAKPVLSFGKDFDEGGILHLEKGKSFYIPAGHTSKVQVVKMKKSFYAQVADVCAAEDFMDEEDAAALFEEDEAAAAALPPGPAAPAAAMAVATQAVGPVTMTDGVYKMELRLRELGAPIYGTKEQRYLRILKFEKKLADEEQLQAHLEERALARTWEPEYSLRAGDVAGTRDAQPDGDRRAQRDTLPGSGMVRVLPERRRKAEPHRRVLNSQDVV